LLPIFLRIAHQHGYQHIRTTALRYWQGRPDDYHSLGRKTGEDENLESSTLSDTRLLDDDEQMAQPEDNLSTQTFQEALTVRETAHLSLEFCLLWFVANYLVAACLTYTSVASSTILTSTSSIWTLLFGALVRVEKFSIRKLIGVLASLAGIVLISSVDLSGDNDENRGSFPHKSQRQIAIGDSMAFFSAVMYGVYTVVMKKRIGNENRVNMPLFFGLVGFFNAIFLWPGFFILHFTGVEAFELPPTGKIWWIVLVCLLTLFYNLELTSCKANSVSSFLSDYCWAYAMLLTTPLVVTVGLSLTIPLSLIGQMILRAQYSSALYWVGACIVFLSFLFVNHESRDDDDPPSGHDEPAQSAAQR
jgi:solute carrier family 35, member F5